MDGKVQELAARFEAANRDVIAAIADASDAQLAEFCPAEQCTRTALGCHVAEVHHVVADWLRGMLANGTWPAVTMADVDRANAEAAQRNATCSRDEVIDRLRRYGAEATALVQSLTEDDLDRSAPFTLFGNQPTTVRTFIERVLIGDPVAHLASIRTGTATPV
jgi:hypothetical protein